MNSIIQNYCSDGWNEYIEFHSKIVQVKKGDFIFETGQAIEGLHIIHAGKVKITTKNGNDTERIIRLAADGDIIGHRGFGGSWKYSVSAIALENTDLIFIPLKIFNEAVIANSSFSYAMMIFFAEELRESERLASQLPVRNMVASVLYNNYEVFGFAKGSETKLSFTLSRTDLASQAGVRYETLVRTLAELNTEKVIKIEGKFIHLCDIEKLKSIKEGELN